MNAKECISGKTDSWCSCDCIMLGQPIKEQVADREVFLTKRSHDSLI